jgi:Single Cache domain 2
MTPNRSISGVVVALGLSLAAMMFNAASAQQGGTSEEAKALLEKAIAEVRADEKGALETFNKADGEYRDRDLYVFCFDAGSGVTTAHPTNVGQNIRDERDETGKAFGEEMFTSAKEDVLSEISYKLPRPGESEPTEKHSYYTRAGNQVCGVGYYE